MEKSKYHPILFSTPMVQAILEGRKTQTRRIVKKKYSNTDLAIHEYHSGKTKVLVELQNDAPPPRKLENGKTVHTVKAYEHCTCPYNVGDVLWVRETFELVPIETASIYETKSIVENVTQYKADGVNCFNKWKPSIHMPKQACRIFLKIKSIRAERLIDISEQDAIAEGAIQYEAATDWMSAKYGFQMIWETINGKESWCFNPFVWVYEFERIEKPLDFI